MGDTKQDGRPDEGDDTTGQAECEQTLNGPVALRTAGDGDGRREQDSSQSDKPASGSHPDSLPTFTLPQNTRPLPQNPAA